VKSYTTLVWRASCFVYTSALCAAAGSCNRLVGGRVERRVRPNPHLSLQPMVNIGAGTVATTCNDDVYLEALGRVPLNEKPSADAISVNPMSPTRRL
jgi:hypothetical protein